MPFLVKASCALAGKRLAASQPWTSTALRMRLAKVWRSFLHFLLKTGARHALMLQQRSTHYSTEENVLGVLRCWLVWSTAIVASCHALPAAARATRKGLLRALREITGELSET